MVAKKVLPIHSYSVERDNPPRPECMGMYPQTRFSLLYKNIFSPCES